MREETQLDVWDEVRAYLVCTGAIPPRAEEESEADYEHRRPEPLERVHALALLEAALERFHRGERAAARDLFVGIGRVTTGDLQRFARAAVRFLEADGGFPSDGAMEVAHARLTAGFPLCRRRDRRAGGLRLVQDFNFDAGHAVHRQPLSGGAGEIDDPAPMVRPPVVDSHGDRLTVLEVSDPGLGAEGQPPVGGGEPLRVKAFAARGFLAVKTRSVPGRFAHLGGARLERDGGGERQGDWQHEGQEPGEHPTGPARRGMALLAFVHERTSSVGS